MLGRPGVVLVTPGSASDVTTAPAVLAEAPGRIRRLAADKSYDADWLRAELRKADITPVIPGKRRIRHDKRRYRECWRIEATFNGLKDFRRIATRYDKLARNYAFALALAAAIPMEVETGGLDSLAEPPSLDSGARHELAPSRF